MITKVEEVLKQQGKHYEILGDFTITNFFEQHGDYVCFIDKQKTLAFNVDGGNDTWWALKDGIVTLENQYAMGAKVELIESVFWEIISKLEESRKSK